MITLVLVLRHSIENRCNIVTLLCYICDVRNSGVVLRSQLGGQVRVQYYHSISADVCFVFLLDLFCLAQARNQRYPILIQNGAISHSHFWQQNFGIRYLRMLETLRIFLLLNVFYRSKFLDRFKNGNLNCFSSFEHFSFHAHVLTSFYHS